MRLLILIILLVLGSSPAISHKWYPKHCCNEKDCRMLKLLRKTGTAMVFSDPFKDGGELVINYKDLRYAEIGESPDGEYHVCTIMDAEAEMYDAIRCFFQPKLNAF